MSLPGPFDLEIRTRALEQAVEATRPVPVEVGSQVVHGAYSLPLPDNSRIVQTAAVFEAYLRSGAIT
jgi:hypothetical protein